MGIDRNMHAERFSVFNAAGSRFLCPSERDRVAVLGLGNVLLSDEGAGVHAAVALKNHYAFSPCIDVIDGGTMGLDLLPLFQDRDRLLVIDAVDFGKSPGHIGILEGDGVAAVLNTKLSVHHIGLTDLIFAARLTRDTPLELCLIGIQPKSLDIGLEMTSEISTQLDRIIESTLLKLKQWDIACLARSSQKCDTSVSPQWQNLFK